MPIVLGHEAAGVVEQVGPAARGVKAGDQWCCRGIRIAGNAFTATATRRSCARNISAKGPKARAFDGESRATLADGARAPAIDVYRRVRRILHRIGPAGYSGAEGDPVRPRLPDRLRRDDGRWRRAQSGCDRAWRHRDGGRLRRGRPRRGARRAAGWRGRDHRGRSRSGETCAGATDGRNRWRRCVKGRRDRCRKTRNGRTRRRRRDRGGGQRLGFSR